MIERVKAKRTITPTVVATAAMEGELDIRAVDQAVAKINRSGIVYSNSEVNQV